MDDIEQLRNNIKELERRLGLLRVIIRDVAYNLKV